ESVQAGVRLLLPSGAADRHRGASRLSPVRPADRVRQSDALTLRRLALSPAPHRRQPGRPRRAGRPVGQRQSLPRLHPRGAAGARVIVDCLAAVVQLVLVALGAPLLIGLVRTLKARLVGRRGPSPWQPYADLRKLLGKERVVSTTTSWIFSVTPIVLAATMLVSALIVPLVISRPALGFAGNVIVLMYLFLVATFFLALAGLDAGSAFGGMGASREVAVAALAEPTIVLAVFALAMRAGTINLGGVVER